MNRKDNRRPDQLRELTFEPNFILYPEGSVLVSTGNTRVLCNVTLEERIPAWMKEQEKPGGWVTAEYSMLPRSTHTRNRRETSGLRGRTQEISRLIGRALRSSVNLEKLGERTCTVDCDVLQADGGTRTAAVTGGYVALAMALHTLIHRGQLAADVFLAPVAATSVGCMEGTALLDLCYEEDIEVDVDANFVMNGEGQLVEVQGTAEGHPFAKEQFQEMLDLASKGIHELVERQRQTIDQWQNEVF